MDGGWNRIFAGFETFLTFFLISMQKVNFPTDETRFSHNALTRRIDPRPPEARWIFLSGASRFRLFPFWAILAKMIFWASWPRLFFGNLPGQDECCVILDKISFGRPEREVFQFLPGAVLDISGEFCYFCVDFVAF